MFHLTRPLVDDTKMFHLLPGRPLELESLCFDSVISSICDAAMSEFLPVQQMLELGFIFENSLQYLTDHCDEFFRESRCPQF